MFISVWISLYDKIMLDKLCFFHDLLKSYPHSFPQIKNHGWEAVVYICFLLKIKAVKSLPST